MLPSVRRDLEELEARLDTILNKQLEIEANLLALRPDLSGAMQGETDAIFQNVAQGFDAQIKWLAGALSSLRGEIAEQGALEKTEILAAIAEMGAQNQARFDQLQTRNDELSARVQQFESAWRDRVELEIEDVSESSVRAWSEKVGERLRKFAQSQGMPRAFAWQLLQELKELNLLNLQFDDAQIQWPDRLDDLHRALFASERTLPWTCLTPHNSSAAQRSELRALETAIAQLRSHCQERLRRVTGIAPLEIVPRATRFDASQHESNEFLEVPTTEAKQHNLILSVEKMGFTKTSALGESQLLRPARVRRYALQHSGDAAPKSARYEAIAPEIAPEVDAPAEIFAAPNESFEGEMLSDETVRDEMPRVSGQL